MIKIIYAEALISGLIVSLIPAMLFTPVTGSGDTSVYINYALEISRGETGQNFITRAPLYPLLLAGLIKLAGIACMPRIVLVIQYFLNFLSSVLLAAVLIKIMSRKAALLAAVLFYISFSSIWFGYMLLTETLTVFLFMSALYLLIGWIGRGEVLRLSFLGAVTSMMVLARFNTFPLIFTFLFLVVLLPWIRDRRINLKRSVCNLGWFLLPLAIILNGYSLFNYSQRGFYGLFPSGGSPFITRNAVIATIDGDETVSEKNKEVFDLFMEGRRKYYLRESGERKGSIPVAAGNDLVRKLYSGYQIYLDALPGLCTFYNLDPSSPEPYLSKKLAPFYREVIKQNRADLWIMRTYSLLNSFRSSTGIIIPGKETINLNMLPGSVVIIYKFLVLMATTVIFLYSIFYSVIKIINRTDMDPALLSLMLLFLSFYFINFIFGTAGDANRFKYPSEPLMIGLGVYFLNSLNLRLKTLKQRTP